MNVLLFALAFLSLAATQLLEGGYDFLFCLPGYGLLALGALLSWWPRRREPIPREAVDGLAAAGLFFAYISVRALFSPEEYLARKDLYMALAAMALYLLVALNLTSSKWRGLFVAGLLLMASANCIVGVIQFVRGQNFMVFDFLPRPGYGSRASGFYGYPNHLAVFLEVGLMMGLGLAFWSRWRPWINILAGYAAAVCLLGILITGSRGGYVATAAGLAVFCLFSLRLAGKLALGRATVLIVAGCLIFGVLGWGVQHFVSKSSLVQARVEQSAAGEHVRFTLWKAALRQFQQHPIVGTGSGTFLYYGRQFRGSVLANDPVHAHNEFLELLAEYGILGIAAAFMFLDSHLRSGWKSFSRAVSRQSGSLTVGGNSLALTVGAMSAAAACMVHSLMDFTLHMPANMLVMAFVFGLLAHPGGTREPVSESNSSGADLPAWLRLAVPALGLWIGVRALPTLPAEFSSQKAQKVISDWKYMESGEAARALEETVHRGMAWDKQNPLLHLYSGMAETALASQSADPVVKKEWSAKAIDSYGNAVRLAPHDTRNILSLAWALDLAERFAESESLLKRALELDPNSLDVHYAYASHLHAQGKLAEAAAEYQASLKLGGGQSAQMGLDRIAEDMKAPPGSTRP